MTGALTLELQAELGPELAEIFALLGHDLVIVFGPDTPVWNAPGGSGGATISIRGLLRPADARRQALAAGAGLPIPQFEAYLPMQATQAGITAPLTLSVPGWHVTHEGRRLYPIGDARDEEGQGLVWIVQLGAPGEVTRGDTQPDWTVPPAP
ncbi:hypothetical protein [Deinococcus yunweiensis]|uniref:hypothetical protein n=1 Tax=Deinococcus yunweiensis TaxID=367282 RepID=UPI00398E786D